MDDTLAQRKFSFDAPKNGVCDLLVVAGEHSGDEQAERMVSAALKKNPAPECLRIRRGVSQARGRAASFRHDELYGRSA